MDLDDIYKYITYKLCNYIAAVNITENIQNKINSLDILPYRGTYYSGKSSRFLIYKNYLILYKIQEKEKLIIIKRIIHRNVNK